MAEDFRSSDSKEVRTTNPGAMNYNSTSQSTAQMNPYGNNPTAFSFPPPNIHTSTPINEAGFPFMDPMMDNLYSENVMRNFSLQPAPSGNLTSTIFGNANSILYGMDNYLNDVPQQGFHSTEECNIGNNIKIRISIDSKIPVEFLRNKSNMNICHQTVSVSPGKMTPHLQIHYIMEKIHPQMIKEYEEQVR